MNEQTLVAVYDTVAHAEAAVLDLKSANVPAAAITQHAKADTMSGTTMSGTMTEAEQPKASFWSKMIGTAPAHETTVYDRSMESGSTVVTVKVPDEHVDRVTTLLEKHNPIDLDERAASYGATETTTTRTTTAPMGVQGTAPTTGMHGTTPATGMQGTATDGGSVQLSEETLSVGKRAVSGGTTRIRRYVVETPVEEQVSLHSEKVTMERRPVTGGREVGTTAFTDKTIEMTETSEEAVVAKTARVVEEVGLHKESSDRVETVKDTVRRDEVEIENVPGGQTATSRTTETAPVMPTTPGQSKAKI